MSDNNLQNIIQNVANENSASKKQAEEIAQIIVFELDKEEYALKITDLREIISLPTITPIPNAPEFIRGIFNLRGKIVVIVDLEKRFNFKKDDSIISKHVIITEVNGNDFGVVVDEVKEVLRVPVSSIKPTPQLISSKIHAEYLSGVIVFDSDSGSGSRIIVLLDLPKLLEDKELLDLGSAIKQTTK